MAGYGPSKSKQTALGGILAAASLAFLWLASIVPSGRLGLAAVAGLFPVAAVLAVGRNAGYLCWAASGLLALLIVPDKGVSLLYLTFLGLYPVVKNRIEAIRRRSVEWILKLAYFNAALAIFWLFLRELFLQEPPSWLGGNALLLFGLSDLVFVVYDLGLSRLIALIRHRIRM